VEDARHGYDTSEGAGREEKRPSPTADLDYLGTTVGFPVVNLNLTDRRAKGIPKPFAAWDKLNTPFRVD
jgi:hypothetical protein